MMKLILRMAWELRSNRRGVTSLEYGITAAMMASAILFAALSIQNMVTSQTSTRCYPQPLQLDPQKV